MKALLMTLSVATLAMAASNPAQACTITPKGDSQLRVEALHETIDHMEVMTGFAAVSDQIYRVTVKSYENGGEEVRTFKLENTSPMCPIYKATRLN